MSYTSPIQQSLSSIKQSLSSVIHNPYPVSYTAPYPVSNSPYPVSYTAPYPVSLLSSVLCRWWWLRWQFYVTTGACTYMNCHMQFLSSVIYNPYPELYTAPIQYHMQPFSSVIYSHIQCHTQPYLVIYIPYPVLYTAPIQYHTQPLSSVIPSPIQQPYPMLYTVLSSIM